MPKVKIAVQHACSATAEVSFSDRYEAETSQVPAPEKFDCPVCEEVFWAGLKALEYAETHDKDILWMTYNN